MLSRPTWFDVVLICALLSVDWNAYSVPIDHHSRLGLVRVRSHSIAPFRDVPSASFDGRDRGSRDCRHLPQELESSVMTFPAYSRHRTHSHAIPSIIIPDIAAGVRVLLFSGRSGCSGTPVPAKEGMSLQQHNDMPTGSFQTHTSSPSCSKYRAPLWET